MDKALVASEFQEHFQNYNLKHIKISSYSAWAGSTWERLIRTIKSRLYKTVGRSSINYFELLTIISDIQAAINDRPLTYRLSENDLEIITPSSFLRFNINPSLMLRDSKDCSLWECDLPSRSDLVKTLDLRDQLFSHFKSLWYELYLLNLRDNYSELHEVNWQNKIRAGEVVLVKLPNKPRPFWLLGRVLELVVGHDNKVRSVKLKRGDGQIQHHSVKHLYPLELSLTHSNIDSSSIISQEVGEVPNQNNQGYSSQGDSILSSQGDSILSSQGDSILNSQGDSVLSSQGDSALDSTQGDIVTPHNNDPVSDKTMGGRPKRKAAVVCKEKIKQWCPDLDL